MHSSKRYRFATRLNSFRTPGRGVPDALRAMAGVGGLSAVELNYPQHFNGLPEEHLASFLQESGLRLTALNLRFEGEEFAHGAFTNPGAATRQRAIRLAQDAVELAVRLDAGHVILWMADDGYDYPFQVDYARLWSDEIDGFRLVAAHDPAVRVSVEYRPSDPRRFSLVRTMGDALLAARDVALPNFGVTLDVCHGLMIGESPAAAATLALRGNLLFGVHLNDGHGRADDGLAVGSVHPWHTLELLAELRRHRYDGTIYFDTFPTHLDPAAECEQNIAFVLRCDEALDRLEVPGISDELAAARERHDALAVQRLLRAVFPA